MEYNDKRKNKTQRLMATLKQQYGMRYQEVAKELGVSETAAYYWSRGSRQMHKDHAHILLKRMRENSLFFSPDNLATMADMEAYENRVFRELVRKHDCTCFICLRKFASPSPLHVLNVEDVPDTIHDAVVICDACLKRKGNYSTVDFVEVEILRSEARLANLRQLIT